MASTYSTDLRLELIGNGDQTGTWGTTTNTNLGTLLEEAIVGQASVSITDGVNTVITISDGASSTARKHLLTLTGTLTAARTLEVPAKKKNYLIYNNTSGGFAVTVKVNGQTGVSIPNGAKRLVYCNGTDVFDAINDLPSGTTIAGSALVSASSTTTFTNKTLTDPTINVRDNALSIQDNADATKQLRFEASGITAGNTRTLTAPDYNGTIATLAGTETLTNKTLSSPTLSGTISATGTATFSNAITVPVGSTTTAAVNFASDPNTGFYSPGADQLRLITAGADRINIAADGSVTITGNLTVNGSFASGGSGAGVTTDGTQTLTNKTIDTAGPNTLKVNGNTLSASAGTATITLFNSTDTVVGRNTTDTLTNKTLTSPTINGGTISGITFASITVADSGLTIQDNADATKQLRFEVSGITTGTTRTITVPDANGTLVFNNRSVATGTGLTGGGDLSADRTISLATIATGNVLGNFSGSTAAPGAVTPTNILDNIGNTRGSFVVRGVSTWNALVPGTSGYVLSSAGAGADPAYVSPSAVIDNIGNTRGSVLYRGSGAWATLSPGTSGYVLTSAGAGADPAYQSPSTIVDGIGNTRGAILERGASGWTALAPGSSGSVLTSAGAGADPAYQTPSTVLDGIGNTRGSLLYRGSGGWAAVVPSAAGKVLRDGGSGADPSWVGGMTLLASGTAASAATLDLTLTSGYKAYRVYLYDYRPVTNGQSLLLRVSHDNGSSYITTAGYSYLYVYTSLAASVPLEGHSDAATYIAAGFSVDNASNGGNNMAIDVFPGSATSVVSVLGACFQYTGGSQGFMNFCGSYGGGARATNIRFLFQSGNIQTMDYALYGIS